MFYLNFENMRKYVLIIPIMLIGLVSFGQYVEQLLGSDGKSNASGIRSVLQSKWQDSTNYKLNVLPDYFMLGTFSDYLNRFYGRNKEVNIDKYAPTEKELLAYLVTYIQDKYQMKAEKKLFNDLQSELNNPQLAQYFNKFYTDNGDLIEENFDHEDKKYSFLLGTYFRYGEKVYDNIYKIRIVNSSKDKVLYPILKELGSNKIYYKNLRDFIPVSEYFYFEATPKMVTYFESVNLIKEGKAQAFRQHPSLKDLKEEDMEGIEKLIVEKKEKEVQMVKNLFYTSEF